MVVSNKNRIFALQIIISNVKRNKTYTYNNFERKKSLYIRKRKSRRQCPNLGLNDEVAEGMVKKTGNPHFVYDSYRRFVQMYGDVVMGLKPVNKEDIDPFEAIIEKVKEEQGVTLDKDLSVESLKKLVELFKAAIKEQTGQDFPTNPIDQLWGAICAVFRSWMNERAILYRKMEGIPDEWGTAVSVMAMVFGNMGDTSATGVCFSRDAGNGENLFNGEYLINAQGEDVVAGIRTPQQITKIGSQRWAERAGISEEERAAKYPSMEEAMPELYKELDALQDVGAPLSRYAGYGVHRTGRQTLVPPDS